MDDSPSDALAKSILQEIAQLGETLAPDDPHLYSVADLEECPRRRWLTIPVLIKKNYLARYHKQVFDSSNNKEWALKEVCSNMIHLILGGAVGGFLLSGRVWEIGPENVCVRTNVLGGFDWQGALHARVRVLDGDPYVDRISNFYVLPKETDMADWLMLQCMQSLTPIMEEISRLSNVPEHRCWQPLASLLTNYGKIAAHVYPKHEDTIQRRTQCLIESSIRLGLFARGMH